MTDLFLDLRNGLRALGKAAAALIPASVRLIASFLFGIGTGDPATFATVLVLLLGGVLVANFVPSRRLLRVDPAAALRVDRGRSGERLAFWHPRVHPRAWIFTRRELRTP